MRTNGIADLVKSTNCDSQCAGLLPPREDFFGPGERHPRDGHGWVGRRSLGARAVSRMPPSIKVDRRGWLLDGLGPSRNEVPAFDLRGGGVCRGNKHLTETGDWPRELAARRPQ